MWRIMDIIIVGATSFIGSNLYQYCVSQGINTVGTTCHGSRDKFIYYDMLDPSTLDNINLKHITPSNTTAVICNAVTSIDECYLYQDKAYQINVVETLRLIERFKESGIKIVFLSSDAVFDGKKGFYSETDKSCPITVYGKYKEKIEKILIKSYSGDLIVRISKVATGRYGDKDILNEFYMSYKNGKEIKCIKNQMFTLTAMEDIVYGIIYLINHGQSGIWHISNNEMCIRKELADMFFTFLGVRESVIVKEYDLEEMKLVDTRHICGGLNGEKFAKYAGFSYKKIQNIISQYKQEV